MQAFDPERFLAVRDEVLSKERAKKGIGTLGEKSLHAILKAYYEPFDALHEQKIGRYVADIVNEDGIIEIQTRNLFSMKDKLSHFLEVTQVTVVHPVVRTKWLSWIDEETGEIGPRRKSPKTGTLYDAFWEMGHLSSILPHPNLTLCLVMLDMEETRLLNGWSRDRKRGSTRADRIPTALVSETYLHTAEDYAALLPENLPQPFTKAVFAKSIHQPPGRADTVLWLFRHMGLVQEEGKRGREKLFHVVGG